MIKTRCRRCKKLIEFKTTYCKECNVKVNSLKKNSLSLKNKEVEATTKSARWKSLRAEIIRRDKGCCVLCFQRKIITYRTLQVHHIVKRINDPSLIYEPSNLVTVCRSCHEEIEELSPAKQRALLNLEKSKEEEIQYLL